MNTNIYNYLLENSLKTDNRENWNDLAKKLGFESGEACRSAFRRERKNRTEKLINQKDTEESEKIENHMSEVLPEYHPSTEIKSDGSIVTDKLIQMSEEDSKSPEFLLKAHGYDSNLWVVVSASSTLWHGLQKGGVDRTLLYRSKITVKPKDKKEISFDDIDLFFKNLKNNVKSPLIKRSYNRSNKILEIDLADLHIGNLPVNQNIISIEERCNNIIDNIVMKCKNQFIEKIYLVNLGDLLHFDTYNQTTTKGTSVTTNTDVYDMFDTGTKILINSVEKLLSIAPVEVIGIQGNHDRFSSYSLMKAVSYYFRDNDSVYVDCSHSGRKFRKFGNSLVMWSHGDMPKNNAYSLIQREARKEFGETKYAEIHSGHYHSQQTIEKDGVIIRYLPSLASSDAWHYQEGYTGAVRSTVSFLWDKEKGLEEIWFENV